MEEARHERLILSEPNAWLFIGGRWDPTGSRDDIKIVIGNP
jgi:hypothetical protein